jgi:hypothetical protein
VSFLSFCAANVLIDIEPLYYLLHHEDHLHRFFHTYLGASVIVATTSLLFWMMLTLARWVRLPNLFGWQKLTLLPVLGGAIWGGYSHILLDSVMHEDIQPFLPWRMDNPLLHVISLTRLHGACLLTGVVGYAIVEIRRTPLK